MIFIFKKYLKKKEIKDFVLLFGASERNWKTGGGWVVRWAGRAVDHRQMEDDQRWWTRGQQLRRFSSSSAPARWVAAAAAAKKSHPSPPLLPKVGGGWGGAQIATRNVNSRMLCATSLECG